MRLRDDFSQRVVVRPEDEDWRASPASGVDRRMLDRIGDEVARATTIVRFAPNASFDAHSHGGGEEFLVIEGTFLDEHGAYPAGTYVRNPIGTAHTPSIGPDGCTILVKLHQFDPGDTRQFSVDTRNSDWSQTGETGIEEMSLHRYGSEYVRMIRMAPQSAMARHQHDGGEEIFVVSGSFSDEMGSYPKGSWLRNPHGSEHSLAAGTEGALLFVKSGHLPMPPDAN